MKILSDNTRAAVQRYQDGFCLTEPEQKLVCESLLALDRSAQEGTLPPAIPKLFLRLYNLTSFPIRRLDEPVREFMKALEHPAMQDMPLKTVLGVETSLALIQQTRKEILELNEQFRTAPTN
jgi:hypothetical protein